MALASRKHFSALESWSQWSWHIVCSYADTTILKTMKNKNNKQQKLQTNSVAPMARRCCLLNKLGSTVTHPSAMRTWEPWMQTCWFCWGFFATDGVLVCVPTEISMIKSSKQGHLESMDHLVAPFQVPFHLPSFKDVHLKLRMQCAAVVLFWGFGFMVHSDHPAICRVQLCPSWWVHLSSRIFGEGAQLFVPGSQSWSMTTMVMMILWFDPL